MQTKSVKGWLLVLSWPLLGFFVLGTFAGKGLAAEVTPEEIMLWSGVAPGSEEFSGEEIYDPRKDNNGWVMGVRRPTLTLHVPNEQKRTGAGVVICPGGGYRGMTIDKEGHVFAKWLCERGIVAGVLKYRCGGGVHQHPVPLNDAQRALRLMRLSGTSTPTKSVLLVFLPAGT